MLSASKLGEEDWSFTALNTDRQRKLNAVMPFGEIAASVSSDSRVMWFCIERAEARPPMAPTNARRVWASFQVSDEIFDQFYNGRDGLRARFWQSRGKGEAATKFFVSRIIDKVFNAAFPASRSGELTPMNEREIVRSLTAASAKIWIVEKLPGGRSLIDLENPAQLGVQRWIENESSPYSPKGKAWRWTPAAGMIDIKGAFIGGDGDEWIPEAKKSRSDEIHLYGFT